MFLWIIEFNSRECIACVNRRESTSPLLLSVVLRLILSSQCPNPLQIATALVRCDKDSRSAFSLVPSVRRRGKVRCFVAVAGDFGFEC